MEAPGNGLLIKVINYFTASSLSILVFFFGFLFFVFCFVLSFFFLFFFCCTDCEPGCFFSKWQTHLLLLAILLLGFARDFLATEKNRPSTVKELECDFNYRCSIFPLFRTP